MMKTADLARHKWAGILSALGVDRKYLTGKHGPCPIPGCGGTDRFRFDNKEGRGTFYCSHCGAGTGIDLLNRVKGWDFRTAAQQVDAIVGAVREEKPRRQITDRQKHSMQRRVWNAASIVTEGDEVYRYLAGRNTLPGRIPPVLRLHPECPAPFNGGYLPAMLALVQGSSGVPVNVHRTFLGPNGKAEMDNPRAMMPGEIPEGAAVRLYPAGKVLGIAEGIETAIAAAKRFQVPVWSAINSTMLAKWVPPERVERVIIFGDNDKQFGGQAAAYALAHKIASRLKLDVEVKIPEVVGADWADAFS